MGAIAAVPAHAQSSQASIRGTITDAGQAVSNSRITLINVNTGYRREGTTSTDGSYNFSAIGPGTYRLEITTANGVRSTDNFTLNVSQTAQLDLDVAAGQATDVTGQEPANGAEPGTEITAGGTEGGAGDIIVTGNRLQTLEGGEVGVTITQRLIEQLPQVNRNFLAFADLAPGVQFQTGANGNSSIRGGAQQSNSVNVFIDGVSQKDFVLKNGITGQDSSQGNPFPQLAIGEYRVLSSNYKAEFDQVSSVAITASTKSGTNEFHGEGFFDFTNQDLRAKRPTEKFNGTDKVETQDMQFGGALGGPIIKDVMHFFVSYEGKRQQQPVDIRPDNDAPISSLPSEYQDYFGSTNRDFNEDLYFGKIDIVPTDSDLIEVTAKYRNETGQNLNTGPAASETRTNVDTEELRVAGRWQHSTDNWVNELRVSYQDVKWAPQPTMFSNGYRFQQIDQNGDNYNRFALLQFGGSPNYQNKGQKGWTAQEDFTWTGFDRHTIKTGVKASWIKLNTQELNFFNPLYSYNSIYPGLSGFNDSVPYQVEFGAATGIGDTRVKSNNFQFGAYIQDDWEVTDRLTLNLGLRWDFERNPAYLDFATPADAVAAVSPENYPNLVNASYNINDFISTGDERETFMNAFQPRVGFSYDVDGTGTYTIFGGYGRSYDRNQFDFLQLERSGGAFPRRTFRFFSDDPLSDCTPAEASSTCLAWDPVYLTEDGRQQLLAGTENNGGGRELRFIDNDLKNPYSDQFSLGLRTSFDPIQIEVGYMRIVGKDGFTYILGNRSPDGEFFTPDPNSGAISSPFRFSPTGYGSILLGVNGLETHSDSGYLKFTKNYTPSSPWSFNATYTYTEAEDNGGSTYSFDYEYPEDYPFTRTLGVPKHRFVAAGSVDLPLDFSFSGRLTVESPTYVRGVISSADPFQRVIVDKEAEGNGDRWGKRQVDIALTKYVPIHLINDESRLRFRVDIINLFNDRNYVDYNGSPTDDTRTDASPTVFGERFGYNIGGNPPRTIKLTAGFSF
ncbi:TonB-dependent receptor [Stakelama saccharophila]|uniref:TonB-dependent receptor n=1 Tax=Stakelama saccharophila TaxID=3075605 RepID=A0ABZ0BBJ1_9SPHN|nr:TonB-dependent receptor [Stakelama sp. W311]WNO54802.1 TonB-dependent receptor [Stakelama sp. W311]